MTKFKCLYGKNCVKMKQLRAVQAKSSKSICYYLLTQTDNRLTEIDVFFLMFFISSVSLFCQKTIQLYS